MNTSYTIKNPAHLPYRIVADDSPIAHCNICPNECQLTPGRVGACRARINKNGQIVPLAYAKPCSIAVDPMEKKPLFHFFPGESILSLGMAGCNLHCKNCQNHSISQVDPRDIPYQSLPPDQLVKIMQTHNLRHVAYTYTEPLVAYEYVLDCAKAVHDAGFFNVLVSAAYVNIDPLEDLLPFIDGANIDLKSMSDEFYRSNCKASLQPVLDALKCFKKFGVVLEITNLVVPTMNDNDENFDKIANFVANELGVEIPLHFSRFFPRYKLLGLPPTQQESLDRAKLAAKNAGLQHVYAGNTPGDEVTYCANCKHPLITRRGYSIISNTLINGACPNCGNKLYGLFKSNVTI